MIIKASTADEVAAANNGGAAGYPPQYQHLQSQQHLGVQPSGSSSISSPHRRARVLERDRERGDASPRPNTSPPVPTSNNPYPPSYPASQSAPGSLRSVAGGSSGSQVLLTTHVFAPVVTGAPTKKTKFPNTPGEFLSSLLVSFGSGFSSFFKKTSLVFLSCSRCSFFSRSLDCFPFENSPYAIFLIALALFVGSPKALDSDARISPCWRLVGHSRRRLVPILDFSFFNKKVASYQLPALLLCRIPSFSLPNLPNLRMWTPRD